MGIDLRKKDLETLRSIIAAFQGIKSARVFGSRANGTAARASDIDLAIDAPGMPDSDWHRLTESLENAPIIYKIDVVRLDRLENRKLRERVEKEGVDLSAGVTGRE
jgi:proline iminopeptidase